LAYFSNDIETWSASSRWGDDQGARHAGLGAAGLQPVDHRQGEGGGLAGAGLGDAQHVTPVQGVGDGLGLDRGCGGVAGVGDSLKGRGRQAQF
jgi:hypothetical protein